MTSKYEIVKILQNFSRKDFGKVNQKFSKCSYPITPLLGTYTEETIREIHKNVFIYKESPYSIFNNILKKELKIKLAKLWNIQNVGVVYEIMPLLPL